MGVDRNKAGEEGRDVDGVVFGDVHVVDALDGEEAREEVREEAREENSEGGEKA